jgi:hypothetical protein
LITTGSNLSQWYGLVSRAMPHDSPPILLHLSYPGLPDAYRGSAYMTLKTTLYNPNHTSSETNTLGSQATSKWVRTRACTFGSKQAASYQLRRRVTRRQANSRNNHPRPDRSGGALSLATINLDLTAQVLTCHWTSKQYPAQVFGCRQSAKTKECVRTLGVFQNNPRLLI